MPKGRTRRSRTRTHNSDRSRSCTGRSTTCCTARSRSFPSRRTNRLGRSWGPSSAPRAGRLQVAANCSPGTSGTGVRLHCQHPFYRPSSGKVNNSRDPDPPVSRDAVVRRGCPPGGTADEPEREHLDRDSMPDRRLDDSSGRRTAQAFSSQSSSSSHSSSPQSSSPSKSCVSSMSKSSDTSVSAPSSSSSNSPNSSNSSEPAVLVGAS